MKPVNELEAWIDDPDTIPPALINACRDAIRREFGNNGTDGYYKRILSKVFAAYRATQVGEVEPVGMVYTMEALVPGGRPVSHVTLRKSLTAGTKLYTHPSSPAGDWRPISEAPKDESSVLVWDEDHGAGVCLWDRELQKWIKWWHPYDGPAYAAKATHWQPLPQPPGQEKGE